MGTMLAIFVGCAALSAILLAGGFAARKRLGAAATLCVTFSLCVVLLVSLLSGIYLWDGARITREGAGPMGELLPSFEKTAAEPGARPGKEFRVWVIGDSTHVSRGEQRTPMLSALRDAAHEKGIEDIRIDGIHWPGFNGYEYYFFLNKLLEHPPDLLVLPLDLRAFGQHWYQYGENKFSTVERYCRWSEVPVAARLSGPQRKITWPGILLRKLDWTLFDSRGEAFFNGLKVRADSALGVEAPKPQNDAPPLPEPGAHRTPEEGRAWQEAFQRQGRLTYEAQLTRDHPLIQVHHALDRLAFGHGIGVMYYTVQTPDARARQDWNFTTLRFALSGDSGVRFITMTDTVPREDFEFLEHFRLPGMRLVASRLVDEMVLARDDAKWRASLVRPSK